MKIAYIAMSLPHGSAETFLVPEIREFVRQGHELLVVPVHPRGNEIHDDVVPLMPIMLSKSLISFGILVDAVCEAIRSPFRTGAALLLILKSRTVMITIKNLTVFPKALWLARLARRSGVQHIHAEWGGCTATMGAIASKVSNIPWSFTVHSWELVENNLLKEKSRSAEIVRVISRFGEERLRNHVGGGAPVHLIHVGVDLPVAQWKSRRPRECFSILVVAALLPIKGIETLIQAWTVLRSRGIDVSVDIFGEGPLEKGLNDLIREAGAQERLVLRGLVFHDRLLSEMSTEKYDATVLPSIVAADGQQEGIPLALVEAMARGIPAISTQTGGIVELLEGGAGLLVPPGDPEALADAIEALSRDPELHAHMQASGRKKVVDQFGVESTVRELAARMAGTISGFADRSPTENHDRSAALSITWPANS